MVERIGRPCGVLVAKLIEDVGGGVNILAAAIKSPLLDLSNGLVLPGTFDQPLCVAKSALAVSRHAINRPEDEKLLSRDG